MRFLKTLVMVAFAVSASAWPYRNHTNTNTTHLPGQHGGHGQPPFMNTTSRGGHSQGSSEHHNLTEHGDHGNRTRERLFDLSRFRHHPHGNFSAEDEHRNHTNGNHTNYARGTERGDHQNRDLGKLAKLFSDAANSIAGAFHKHKSHARSLGFGNHTNHARGTKPDPVGQMLFMAPTSKTCTGAQFASECATSNPQTVSAIIAGFTKYGIVTPAEQAAVLSWMTFESSDFKYNHNHFPAPGRPGQGLRNMMMPNFVKEYANSIPELKSKVAKLTDPDAILALVQPDQYAFAAASWYYSTKCTDAQKKAVAAGGQTNWQTAFITGCVQTTVDDQRVAKWKLANQALGI